MNATGQNILESQITAVTVYTDRARITRKGTIALQGNETEIVLPELPRSLEPESVRVQGSGSVAVQLLGIRTERAFATEPVAERVAELTAAIERLNEQRRSLSNQQTALQLQRTFVEKLGEQSVGRVARSLAQQETGLAQTSELLVFLGTRYTEFAEAIAHLQTQMRDLDIQTQVLQQELYQIQSPHPNESYQMNVAIAPTGSGELHLEVTYVCLGASWEPLYDFRLSTTTGTLSLIYQAQIQQNTGEDWQEVDLTLSTAKPGVGTLPPKLQPWYLDVVAPPPARAIASAPPPMVRSYGDQPMADGMGYPEVSGYDITMLASAPVGGAQKMATVSATVNREGGVVTFQAGGGNRIPSDGAFHKVTLFNDDYPIRLEHVAMPKLVSFAYVQAIATNPTHGVTLLPGNANIFRDEMFVGTSPIENVAPGQEFRLNLGIDESLKLERDLIEREVDKKLIGGQRRISFGYRIRVENLNTGSANIGNANTGNANTESVGDDLSVRSTYRSLTLKLTEQLPVSRNEQIKVRLTRSTPTLQPSEMGTLEWTLVLPPHAKQEVSYQFTVEHPTNLKITGLDP